MHIFLWIITSFNLFGQTEIWTTISPLNDCPDFKVDYTYDYKNENYKLRFLLSEMPIVYEDYQHPISSLKEIGNLNDLFKLKAINQCPNIINDINDNQCNGIARNNIFSDDYVYFINLITQIVNKDNICEEILEYKKLQDEVVDLNRNDFLDQNKTKKFGQLFLKLFTDKETDKLIDTFYTCGGKNNSEVFIKNMVLVEARNACIIPAPPGYLSWEEAEKMASDMAKPYANTSLMKMNFIKDKIEADAYLTFTETVVAKQIKGMIPTLDEKKTNEIIQNLTTYKSLKSVIAESNANKIKIDGEKISKSSQKSDYLSYVFSLEAPFEIAEKLLPELIEANFSSKLPTSWDDQKKKEFIKNNLSASAMEEYSKCILPYKEKLNIQSDYTSHTKYDENSNDIVKERKKIESTFCEQNPQACNENFCSKSVNYLSESTEISDMEKIQSCAYAGIIKTLPTIFDVLISDKAEEMQNEIKISKDDVPNFAGRIWSEMAMCLNEESFKLKSNHIFPDNSNTDEMIYSTLEKFSSSEFEQVLYKCSDHAEDIATKEFIQQVLLNMPALQAFYPIKPNAPTVQLWNTNYSQKQLDVTNRIIAEAYEPCIEQQYKIVKNKIPSYHLESKDPTLCTPLIEIKAAEIIVDETIKEELKAIKMEKDKVALEYIQTFHSCSLSAYQRAYSSIGSAGDPNKIVDTKSANAYLDNDNTFYGCMNTLITNVSGLIAGYEFDKLLKDPNNGLSNTQQYKKERPNIIATTKNCINKELTTIGNWPKFVKFMETGSFDQIKNKCSLEATKFALPIIVVGETTKILNSLTTKDEEILIPSQISEVISLSAKDLRRKFNVVLPNNIPAKDIVHYSIKEAYANFENSQLTKPQKFCPYDGKKKTNLDEFVCYYSEVTTLHVMEKLHSNLATMVKAKAALVPKQFKEDFFKYFTPQCMYNLYFPKEIAKLPDDPASTKSTFDSLVDQIATGLKYINKLDEPARSNPLKEVETLCKDSSSFKDLKPLKTYKGFDFILKAQIQQQTVESLKSSIEQSYLDDLELYKNDKDYKIYQSFAYIKRSDALHAVSKYLEDPKSFEKLVFNDDKIITYLKENFIEVQTEGSSEGLKLNAMVTEKLFTPKGLNTFASDFIEAQLVGGIGMGGFKDALKETINSAYKDASLLGPNAGVNAVKMATKKLRSLWNPSYIEKTLNWNQVNESTRKEIITSIYDNMILPAAKNTKTNADAVTKRINTHVDSYSYPNYPKDDNGRRTMKAKIAEDIGADIHWYNVIDIRDFVTPLMPLRF